MAASPHEQRRRPVFIGNVVSQLGVHDARLARANRQSAKPLCSVADRAERIGAFALDRRIVAAPSGELPSR